MNPFFNIQKCWWCNFFMLFIPVYLCSQIPSEQRYSMEFIDQTMEEMFQYIENTTHWSVYYEKSTLPTRSFSKKYTHSDIPEIVADILAFSDLDFLNYRDYAIVILPKNVVETEQTALHYQRFSDSNQSTLNSNMLKIGQYNLLGADDYADLRIKIIQQDQKAIRGAKVSVYYNSETDHSDKKGLARISLVAGQYILKVEHPFYQTVEQAIDVYSSGVIKIFMSK